MPPPFPAVEEEIAALHDEIQRIHAENLLMVDDNMAMKRDISASKEELHVLSQVIRKIHADKEAKAKELIQMGLRSRASCSRTYQGRGLAVAI
ncbi:protein FLX-like 3 [Iris pallida]|uniref:Protein FLX-like 3 n=1 Tax=Iris pallida TaxID=29817 RepID=A0AAX6GE45_IRIPA|nr:protein FLX-like 3 [Iris pallida]KAJ6832942.1 protein FLX-like 3 [Iris pallida]